MKGAIKDLVDHDIKILCEWKDWEIEELNVQEDHIYMLVSVPQKKIDFEINGCSKRENCNQII